MTGVALAINANAGAPTYSARAFREAVAGLKMFDGVALSGRQGIRPMGGTAANVVTVSGSTITVNLHAGQVSPSWASITGTYDVALTVIETHSLTPADVTNPRKDIVVGRVYDEDESANGGLRLYRTEYLVGTPGPSPAEQSVPVGAFKIATIDVPKVGSGSAAVTNNYAFTVAAGGVLPVRSQAERDAISNPGNGLTVHRMDKGWQEHHDGTAFRVYPNIVSFGSTAEFTGPGNGQVGYHVPTHKFWEYITSQWVPCRIDLQQQASAFVGSISSATYVPQTGGPDLTFIAPASGAVRISVKAAIVATAGDTTGRAAFEIWTGPTAGAGTGIYSAADNDSIAWQGSNNWEAGSGGMLVTGLTAGSTYTARMVYKRDAGTGTAGFARRRMTITDAAI